MTASLLFRKKHLLTATALGAALGLVLIVNFVFGEGQPDPAWGPNWRIRPLLVTPLVGAAGGAVAYATYYFLVSWGWPRWLVGVVCGLGMLVALWLGIVLGLVGTLWN